jgi:hypothetical protein
MHAAQYGSKETFNGVLVLSPASSTLCGEGVLKIVAILIGRFLIYENIILKGQLKYL